ncbi:MAG: hypothetical protein PF693_18385 [Spirochaetia bacterium]|jgi:uncharacterized integral membrane protein|nr:hypothetical protein [Spirochaetia bacterium]
MFRLIVSVFSLVILAVLIVFNLEYRTSFSFYGLELADIPVMVVAILSFALGVVYSFVFYLTNFLAKKSKNRMIEKGKVAKNREQKLDNKEKEIMEKIVP